MSRSVCAPPKLLLLAFPAKKKNPLFTHPPHLVQPPTTPNHYPDSTFSPHILSFSLWRKVEKIYIQTEYCYRRFVSIFLSVCFLGDRRKSLPHTHPNRSRPIRTKSEDVPDKEQPPVKRLETYTAERRPSNAKVRPVCRESWRNYLLIIIYPRILDLLFPCRLESAESASSEG